MPVHEQRSEVIPPKSPADGRSTTKAADNTKMTERDKIGNLIKKLVAYAKKQLPEDKASLICKFIKLYFSHASYPDLEDRSIADLYGLVMSHWELMSKRQSGEVKLRIFNPVYEEDGWQSTHTIIQVVVEDMPFVIDSIRMETTRRNLAMHMMIHMGGMRVERGKGGNISGITAYSTEKKKAEVESPIYMEIDRQTDPDVLKQIEENLYRVLEDVRLAVSDWQDMQTRMRETIQYLQSTSLPQDPEEVKEVIAFLEWLLNDHFTFIGARDYSVVGEGESIALKLEAGSGRGVLRDETDSQMFRQLSELPEQAREMMLSVEELVIISKTNTRSTVHRDTHTDYIGVKLFNEKGEFTGERRFIGLYTSTAYNSDPRAIPLLRKKVAKVLAQSTLPVRSHAGKDLTHILATLPRDDLFQAPIDELTRLTIGILHLQERRRVRLFLREDAYGRFISCLVYIPRENFDTDLVERIKQILQEAFSGVEVNWTSDFSVSVLARIHYVVRIDPEKRLDFDVAAIEEQIVEAAQSWLDGLRDGVLDYFGEERGNELFTFYRNAFPAGYREVFAPRNAVYDIVHIEKLNDADPLSMSFYRPPGAPSDVISFKLFHLGSTVPLSDALPLLENMGLRVVGETPYLITLGDGRSVWINDFSMTYAKEPTFEVDQVKSIFQDAFKSTWLGLAESDEFNRLVLEAQLTWREITVLRAYVKYLRQTGFTFSPQYIAETFVNNPNIAKLLVEIFKARFDPEQVEEAQERVERLEGLFHKRMDDVVVLDEDRILRRSLDVILATLRTNYFQIDEQGHYKPYLSFKLNPEVIPDLPLPLPAYEIFVYSPDFEGVHLRMGKVARGGLRWSDRREDFRTEVLGLMKAQQVKNSLIVPAGAKGGFVAKNLPVDATRDMILQEGINCYRGFINGLLDVVDNLVDGKEVHPANMVCYDGFDPYFVVAADKGTATFSDIANSIAKEKNFWLGDAFASGGSAGYDHKKIGITARGAWVSAERHFQELGINVNEAQIKVVGIGDMSGDVFGNGMLLSNNLKLVAAFNHQHIFLDPNPDPRTSFEERIRLYNLPRSGWDDYNPELISKGGGVYRRSVKAITLSPEVRKLLDIDREVMVPNELIRAILCSSVDLIWNGGIGTFVKASDESNDVVGDRTNDNIRVNGNELNTRVVCEGGNLGLTQLARVEYELNGGKINTDFIDNSAGVDCSDHEVNIKILLNKVVNDGDMTEKQRNALLVRMTDEVAHLVLQNNYHQNQAISLAAYLSPTYLPLLMRYIDELDERGKINRELECLPDEKILTERRSNHLGLTRPELSVLFAYSKIILEEEIRNSDLFEEDYLKKFVCNAFPTPLRKRYTNLMLDHRLSHEIISTQLSNRLVSEMGIAFVYQMHDETGAPSSTIVKAWAAARKIFHLDTLYADIESLDYAVDATVQLKMYEEVVRLVRRTTRWLLRNRRDRLDIEGTIDYFGVSVDELQKRMPKLILGSDRAGMEERRDALIAANVHAPTAQKIACTQPMYHTLNIIEASNASGVDLHEVAQIYFILVDRLDLLWFRDRVNAYALDTRWAVLARAAYKGDLDWIQRQLTMGVLKLAAKTTDMNRRVDEWYEKHTALIERWQRILTELKGAELDDFAILSVAVRELTDLAQAGNSDN